jgi:hypothetical protein
MFSISSSLFDARTNPHSSASFFSKHLPNTTESNLSKSLDTSKDDEDEDDEQLKFRKVCARWRQNCSSLIVVAILLCCILITFIIRVLCADGKFMNTHTRITFFIPLKINSFTQNFC